MKQRYLLPLVGLAALIAFSGCENKILGSIETDVRAATAPKIAAITLSVDGATANPDGTVSVLPVLVGNSRQVNLTVRNSGSGALELTGTPKVLLSGDPEFALSSAEPSSPLQPGASESFSVTFHPTAVGSYSTIVTIETNVSGLKTFQFTLSSSCFTSDSNPPTGNIAINGGISSATNNPIVLLNLTATDDNGVEKMWISNVSDFSQGSWEAYSSTKSGWSITSGVSSADGTKYVYVKYRDVAGNVSGTYSASIKYDTTKPVGNSARVVTGSSGSYSYPDYITGTSVTLQLSATDATSGVAQMMISNASDFSGASWVTYSTTRSFTLTSGYGQKTFYVKFRDAVGYESNPISGSVYVDDAYEGQYGNSNGEDPYTLYTSDPTNTYYYNSSSSPSALSGQFWTQNYPGYAVLNDVDDYWMYVNGSSSDTIFVEAKIANGGAGPIYLELLNPSGTHLAYGSGTTTDRSITYSPGTTLPTGWYYVRVSGAANSGQQYNLLWWSDWTGI